jgi:hypothetical protein
MSNTPALRSSDIEVLRYMHDTASRYHLHYSNVRSTASSLYLSIGILASIFLLINRLQVGRFFPSIFMIFVFVTTLAFNMVFARWSRACRQLERYYEVKMNSCKPYNSKEHGFRHVFRQIVLSSEYPNTPPEDFPPNVTWKMDEFCLGISIFGGVYTATYITFIWVF